MVPAQYLTYDDFDETRFGRDETIALIGNMGNAAGQMSPLCRRHLQCIFKKIQAKLKTQQCLLMNHAIST
jgi:hypothetical protein